MAVSSSALLRRLPEERGVWRTLPLCQHVDGQNVVSGCLRHHGHICTFTLVSDVKMLLEIFRLSLFYQQESGRGENKNSVRSKAELKLQLNKNLINY